MLKISTFLLYSFSMVMWLPTSFAASWGKVGSFPRDLFKVGYNRVTRHSIHICQANLWGRKQLGISWRNHHQCDLSYAGHIYSVENYRLLLNKQGYWQPYYGFFPGKALILGSGVKKVSLALCRGYYKHSLLAGKTWRGHKYCDVIYQNKIHRLKRYSIFISDRQKLA